MSFGYVLLYLARFLLVCFGFMAYQPFQVTQCQIHFYTYVSTVFFTLSKM